MAKYRVSFGPVEVEARFPEEAIDVLLENPGFTELLKQFSIVEITDHHVVNMKDWLEANS